MIDPYFCVILIFVDPEPWRPGVKMLIIKFLKPFKDSSAFPCVYCCAKESRVLLVNTNVLVQGKHKTSKKRQMPDLQIEQNLRNYSDALNMYSTYQKSGWSAKEARSDRVCSQTSVPSPLLEGSLFIDYLLPDELHILLNEARVSCLFR